MVEKEFSEPRHPQQVRQQGSVPFLWEEKPGTPKKEWKSESVPVSSIPLPLKLVASVPFKWEEKPGKPLPHYSQPMLDSPFLPLSPPKLNAIPSPSVFSPSSSSSNTIHGKLGTMFQRRTNVNHDEEGEGEGMFEMDLESFGFDMDESFSSVPSLLANHLILTVAISGAIPVQQSPVEESSQPVTPTSPASEIDDDTSSYATGNTSLVGASFLECLFPLFSPDSGFLDKAGYHAKNTSPTPEQTKECNCESNCSLMVRRPPTLGELILMSRKRSYKRDVVHIRKWNFSLGFMKRAFGCCTLGTGGSRIDGLHRRLQRPRLKLV